MYWPLITPYIILMNKRAADGCSKKEVANSISREPNTVNYIYLGTFIAQKQYKHAIVTL